MVRGGLPTRRTRSQIFRRSAKAKLRARGIDPATGRRIAFKPPTPLVTFVDATGATVTLPIQQGKAADAIRLHNARVVRLAQTSQAKKELGKIRKVEKRKGKIVFTGVTGKKSVFTEGKIKAVPRVKPVPIVKRLLKAPPTKRERRLAAFERRVLKLKVREVAAGKRAEKVADLFQAIPFLKERKITGVTGEEKVGARRFVKRTARQVLAFPVTATVGFGEQIILAAGKAAATVEGVTLREVRGEVAREAARAGRATPKAFIQSFDIRDPRKLGNIIGIVATLGLAKGVVGKIAAKKGSVKITSATAKPVKGGTIIKQKASFTSKTGRPLKAEVTRTLSKGGRGTIKTVVKDTRGNVIRIQKANIRVATKVKLRLPKKLVKRIAKAKAKVKKAKAGVKVKVVKGVKAVKRPVVRKIRKFKRKAADIRREVKIAARRKIGKAELKVLEAKAGGKKILRDLKEINRNANISIIQFRGKISFRSRQLLARLKDRLRKTKDATKDKIVQSVVRQINKRTPFRAKIVKPKTIAPGKAFKRRFRRLKKREALIMEVNKFAKAIFKKKVKIKDVPPNIRTRVVKRVKSIMRRAERARKRIPIKRVRAKVEKARILKGKEKARMEFRREIIKARDDFLKSERLVNRMKLDKAARDSTALARILGVQRKAISQSGKGQTSVVILKKPKIDRLVRKANSIRKAKTPKQAKQLHKEVIKDVGGTKQQLKILLKKPIIRKSPPKMSIIFRQLAAATIIAGFANNAIARSKFKPKAKVGVLPATQQKPRAKQKPATAQKPAEKVVDKVITVPDTIVTVTSAVALTTIINNVLGSVGRTRFIQFSPRGRIFDLKNTRPKGGLAGLRAFLFKRFKNKRTIFLPDMYSLIFGIKAKPKQKVRLLRPGRIFTGIERRPQVR